MEDTLIKHPAFALPGRKALLKSAIEYEIVLIDSSESLIERSKKGFEIKNGKINKSIFIHEKEKAYPKKPSSYR